ncbi:hypothetical protein PC121_g2630 [Phytophthora cactorum]|nr:hypothetical protein PC120_g3438 [Phytophthora cactorum]KAG3096046.1 hypothetical protein PC121_g2630 [Phytophthora cactorum]
MHNNLTSPSSNSVGLGAVGVAAARHQPALQYIYPSERSASSTLSELDLVEAASASCLDANVARRERSLCLVLLVIPVSARRLDTLRLLSFTSALMLRETVPLVDDRLDLLSRRGAWTSGLSPLNFSVCGVATTPPTSLSSSSDSVSDGGAVANFLSGAGSDSSVSSATGATAAVTGACSSCSFVVRLFLPVAATVLPYAASRARVEALSVASSSRVREPAGERHGTDPQRVAQRHELHEQHGEAQDGGRQQ